MEIKTHIHFEVEKNERKYVFDMPAGASLGEAYDAVFEVLEKIVSMSKEAVDKSKRPECEKEGEGDVKE
jgi:hypothetical protein